MSRRGFSLVGLLSLICLGGYSHCPCDGPEGIESIQRGYLILDDPSPYETEVLSMGSLQAIANIAGGSGQNRLKVFWGDVNDGFLSNPHSQTVCEGSCYGLHTVMNAPCFSFMKGSRPNLACYVNSQWTTSEVPSGDYSNATFAANTNAVWGAFYDPTLGKYDFWKKVSGSSWNLEFTYTGTGTHWDAPFGSIEAALCANDQDLWFAADEVYTNRLDYNLNQLGFNGDLKLSAQLYSGSVPNGFNGYFRSKIRESGDEVLGSFLFPPGGLGPGAVAYSVNGTDGSRNYSKIIQQFSGSFTAVPSLNLFATESKWGAVNNVVLPTPDNRFTLTRVSPDGNATTSRLHKMWDPTGWTGMATVNRSTQWVVAGSFPTDATGSQRRLAESNQVGGGATLTVELITLGSYLNFAQFADGGGLSSEVTVTNTGSEEETVVLLLRDYEGVDLSFDVSDDQLTIPGSAYTGRYEMTIPPNGVRILRTDGAGDVVVGSARLQASSNISGVIAFGGAFGLAGVGDSVALSEGFTAPMQTDQSRGLNTGVAVQNLVQSETTLTAELYSASQLVSTAAPIDLAPLGQKAIYVDQFEWDTEVDFSKFQGILKVTATGRTAATVLQTRPNQLASMPVKPL
jgi:hypothetical protein